MSRVKAVGVAILISLVSLGSLYQLQWDHESLSWDGYVATMRKLQDSDSEANATVTYNDSSVIRCPMIPDNLVGPLKVIQDIKSWEEIEESLPVIQDGGEFTPTDCAAKDSVAIIIPFRNREPHLKVFLAYIHPILMRQNIHYRVFVVSQDDANDFNRAMLFNVGYAESVKLFDWDCFIFHDVDLLPEDDRNLYTCPEMPRHMSVAVDKFKYRLPYKDIFGGVSALSKEHFKQVNGFSNQFWGWGGEDDDMSLRVRDNGLKITRFSPDIARYTMIKHKSEEKSNGNPDRFKMLKKSKSFHKTDGLNNLKYNLLNVTSYPLYTNISVELEHLELVTQ